MQPLPSSSMSLKTLLHLHQCYSYHKSDSEWQLLGISPLKETGAQAGKNLSFSQQLLCPKGFPYIINNYNSNSYSVLIMGQALH